MKKCLLIALLCAPVLALHAQQPIDEEPDTLEFRRDKHNKVAFARFGRSDRAIQKFSNEQNVLKSALQLRNQVDDYRLLKETTDEKGFTHRRYQQFYKGIKVDNAQYMTHARTSVEVINGSFVSIGDISVEPSVAEAQALQAALGSVGAKKYAWEDPALEEWIKDNRSNGAATWFPKGELVIAEAAVNGKDTVRLSWKFSVTAKDPDLSVNVYIDAITGALLKTVSQDCTTNAPGTVQSLYSGAQTMTGDSFAGGFRLRELRNGVQVNTLNINHQNDPLSPTDFVDNDNNWTAVEHTANRGALDAHWGTEGVLDYWRTVQNRNSLNGLGMTINNYVHWGTNVGNAAWRSQYNAMFYGDGGLTGLFFFTSMTSLDIIAHEMGHGVCQFEANLAYEKESGALNESLSDIWGAVIEAQRAPAKQRWSIGEDVGGPIRLMNNPPAFGQPDTYNGTSYVNTTSCTPSPTNDQCGVHTNSGVGNFWFFLLSEGGTGTNDLGNAYTVTGIGITNAAAIVYRMERDYLTSNATFATARDASLQAARDLFGTNSCAEISVANAWQAVGVGARFNTTNFSITGSQYACSSATYVALGPSPAWSISPATGVANIATSGNNATVTKVTDGTITLTATFSGCSITTTTINRTLRVGYPSQVASVFGATPVIPGALYYYYFNCPVPANNIIWSAPSGWSVAFGQGTNRATIQTGSGAGYVRATATACGSTSTRDFYVSIGAGGPAPLRTAPPVQGDGQDSSSIANEEPSQYLIYPNPSRGYFNIIADEKTGPIKTVMVYNNSGSLVQRRHFGSGVLRASLNLGEVINGTYIVEVNGDKSMSRKIVIQR